MVKFVCEEMFAWHFFGRSLQCQHLVTVSTVKLFIKVFQHNNGRLYGFSVTLQAALFSLINLKGERKERSVREAVIAYVKTGTDSYSGHSTTLNINKGIK